MVWLNVYMQQVCGNLCVCDVCQVVQHIQTWSLKEENTSSFFFFFLNKDKAGLHVRENHLYLSSRSGVVYLPWASNFGFCSKFKSTGISHWGWNEKVSWPLNIAAASHVLLVITVMRQSTAGGRKERTGSASPAFITFIHIKGCGCNLWGFSHGRFLWSTSVAEDDTTCTESIFELGIVGTSKR